ncbi:uncharacterized protein LOC136035818 [Artemia franciscana]|uniref:Uncharacterized protein n=1 Tax=Artemia franciscana TaxID=6661 RepID=A0AA88I3V2_ARTSF|nr:hypothetical protein QYM36_003532 [Artemia franciscana]
MNLFVLSMVGLLACSTLSEGLSRSRSKAYEHYRRMSRSNQDSDEDHQDHAGQQWWQYLGQYPSNRNGLIPFPRIGKRQEGNNIPNFDMFDKSVFEKSQEGFGNTSPLQYRSEKALDESGDEK